MTCFALPPPWAMAAGSAANAVVLNSCAMEPPRVTPKQVRAVDARKSLRLSSVSLLDMEIKGLVFVHG